MQSKRQCRRQIRRFHFDADRWLGRFPNAGSDICLSVHRVAIAGDRGLPPTHGVKLDGPMSAPVDRHSPLGTTLIRNDEKKASSATNDENLICAPLNLRLPQKNLWRLSMRQGNRITESNHSRTPPLPINEPLLTQTEAANLLHVEPRTLKAGGSTEPVHVTFAIRGVVSVPPPGSLLLDN